VFLALVAGACSGGGGGGGSPRAHALRACAAGDRFEAAVKRNDDVDTVRAHLNTARREAHAAERGDSLYVGLASGMEALRIAIDNDDAQAARVGIDVMHAECRYARR
jgi:hypothetical protein